ncbi:MAG TPA: DUF4251 domain-containing protein [Chryseolinea sp.]|jgi:hypothetical protein|nr:DUF4251 domain-containing protein [Chryseolinea sp.]
MKYLKCLIPYLLIATIGQAQEKVSETNDIKSLVESKRFVFIAESASPLRGRTVSLTPGFTVVVSSDTITCDLPYYGRAYSAPIGSNEGGFKFTSTDFTYTVKDRKKGGWDISIKAKDNTSSHQIYFTISSSGQASLRAIPSDRQSISYNGYIKGSR